jgi:hypothetical protein
LAALLGIAASAVALAVYRPQLLRPLVQRALAPRGGSASLAGLKLTLSPLALTIEGLVIAGPPQEGDRLRMDHLRVEVIPGRILHGGPWMRRVEASGLFFERLRPREPKGPPDLTPLTRLFDIEELSLSDARLRLALPQGSLAADALRLSLLPGEGGIRRFNGDWELSFRRNGSTVVEGKVFARGKVIPGPAIEAALELAPARLELPWLAGDASGRTALKVTRRIFQAEDLILDLPRARLSFGPRELRTLGPIRLNAAGSATLDGREPRLEVRGLDMGGLLVARGLLSGPTLESLSGAADVEVPRVERLKALFASLLPGRLKGMDLTGTLPFRLSLALRGTERVLDLELLPRDLAFSWPDAGLRCRFGGTFKASSPLQGWSHGRARLDWQLSAGAGGVHYEGRNLPLGALAVRGAAKTDAGSLRVEGIDIRSETLGRLTGDLAILEGGTSGSLKGSNLSAPALLSLAGVVSGRDGMGWSPAGTIDVAARFWPTEGGSRLAATAALERIGFSSPAGDVMGQNLAGRLDLEAHLGPQPLLKADLAMGGGEALWGTVYLNLAQEPLELHAGLTRTGPGEYKEIFLDGGLAGFGRLRLEGNARREGGSWRHRGRLALSETRLGPLFRTFLRDPLAASHPDLAGLRMDGTARMDLAFDGSEKAADLAGRLLLRSVDVRPEGEPPFLSGLDIDLPIAYSLGVPDPGSPKPPGTAAWGRLSLRELRLGGQELGPLEMPVVLVPNRLYLEGGIDASPFGARLSLRRIQVDEPLSPDFRIHLAARLDDLDLARLAGKNPLLEGRLGGLLDPVSIGRHRLTAAGDLTGELFGGRMDIRGVTVDRPFVPGREIGADVTVSRLDMERLSEVLGVGRITGRISGSLAGLRVAYGQPVAFHLTMESEPAKGVTQLVSLKAVNSISLVSTGSPMAGLGSSLMTTFFREFPYAKIGFECNLKNDVFTVRGLIREGGVEYLVKRRLFAGINVINRNPDNRIGFSDMLERARRVTGERSP